MVICGTKNDYMVWLEEPFEVTLRRYFLTGFASGLRLYIVHQAVTQNRGALQSTFRIQYMPQHN